MIDKKEINKISKQLETMGILSGAIAVVGCENLYLEDLRYFDEEKRDSSLGLGDILSEDALSDIKNIVLSDLINQFNRVQDVFGSADVKKGSGL